MQDVRDALGIRIESPYWDEAYKKALSEPLIPEWLTEEYIRSIHEKYGFFKKNLEVIVSAVPHIVKVPELCILAKTLYHILGTKKKYSEAFTSFEVPKAPEGYDNPIGYDSVCGFPILAHLVPSWKELEEKGVEENIIAENLTTLDFLFTYSREETGKHSFTKQFFEFYGNAIYKETFVLGRLRFEICRNLNRPAWIFENKLGEQKVLMCGCKIHKSGNILGAYGCEDEEGSFNADFTETETEYIGYAVNEKSRLAESTLSHLDKNEWKPIYTPADSGLKVHIPYGDRLTKEACEDSYQRAREFFTRCFPEITFKGFHLFCWMLSPDLREILPSESGIIQFQDKYTVFPAKDNAIDTIMYAFGVKENEVRSTDITTLPEDNSLRRGVKKKLLEGKIFHQCYGFFKW